MKMDLESLKAEQYQRNIYKSLSIADRVQFVSDMSPQAFEYFRYFTDIHLRDKQIVPDDWKGRYYIAMCGRGWGKSKMGGHWIKSKVYKKQKGLAIVAPTFKELEEVMVPAILNEFPKKHMPRYVGGNKSKITCHNDIEILCYTSQQEIRGGNFSNVWCDELGKWCESNPVKAKEVFQVLDFACRKGEAQFLITTTPKPWEIFINWKKRFDAGDELIRIVTGDLDENTDLSIEAKKALHKEYDGTRLGRQELYGELLLDNPDSLWKSATLEKCHLQKQIFDKMLKDNIICIVRVVIAVDPAVSTNANSDETGIIVAALCSDNKVYILQDASGKMSPDEWSSKAVSLYKSYNASHIILESNQGGNLLEQAIKTQDRYARTKLIHASVGKKTRFEPVVMAYERGDVFHVCSGGNFDRLENQMMSYNPYAENDFSPDRADAVAYTVYDLLLGQPAPQYRSTRNITSW